MSDINTVAVSGRLTRDPELRHTPSGTAVAKFGIACGRSKKNEGGDGYEEVVSFFDCTVWSGYGELVARKLQKGDLVSVQGRLEQQSWETDGQKRSKVEIIVNDVSGAGMFRSKDEETAPATSEAGASSKAAAQPTLTGEGTSTDDDIPF